MNYDEIALKSHEENRGKVEVISKVQLKTADDLSTAYTPGVAAPCKKIEANPEEVYKYTAKGSLVAIVSDGSAVLGLGNIGGLAGMPVMEGKSILFKEFANIDGFPICLATQNVDEIVNTVKNIAPTFGGINLEDISAPRCFEIENRLKKELDIPVFHDDQHGTAVVVLSGLINACKLKHKELKDLKIVMNGIGAAGSAIARILLDSGVTNLVLCDRNGILNADLPDTYFNSMQQMLAVRSNPNHLIGDLSVALKDADVFIGVSVANCLTVDMVRTMAKDPIVFALANPNPEITPELAKEAGASIICTGRSDYPNQINNVLAFPGIFKGALAVRASEINEEMKLAAANAIAGIIPEEELSEVNVIPSALDRSIAEIVGKAVAEAAIQTGVARKTLE